MERQDSWSHCPPAGQALSIGKSEVSVLQSWTGRIPHERLGTYPFPFEAVRGFWGGKKLISGVIKFKILVL